MNKKIISRKAGVSIVVKRSLAENISEIHLAKHGNNIFHNTQGSFDEAEVV